MFSLIIDKFTNLYINTIFYIHILRTIYNACLRQQRKLIQILHGRSKWFRFNLILRSKFVSDLRRVDVFFRVLRFPPPIKLTAAI